MLRRVLIAFLVLAPLSALATVVMALSMEELTVRAPLVVRGVVHRVDVQWTEGRSRIWTYAEVVVSETLKGAPRTSVLVKQPGGIIGDVGERVAGTAQFIAGEEVVLFLEPAPDEPGAFIPFSMAASKVSLVDRGGKRVAQRDVSGLSFAVPGRRGMLSLKAERDQLGLAETFLNRIRLAARGGGK